MYQKNVTYVLLLCLAFVNASAQNKQRIYTLKQGEKIKEMECGMGITNAADGYILLVERADMESPGQSENPLPNFYAITNQKTYGPYIDPIVNCYSTDGRYSAMVLTKGNPEDYDNAESYVLFNDGKMEGPFKGFGNVTFSDDNSEWVITADRYDAKSDQSSTTIQFKGGKPIHSKKPEYVIFAPKGSASARISTTYTTGDIFYNEYYFSNDTKYGPCETRQFLYSDNGNGYGLLCLKSGQMFMVLNGKEKKVPSEATTFSINPEGTSWALEVVGNNESYIEFSDGKKSESYQHIASGSLHYNKNKKCFGWLSGGANNQVYLHFSNGEQKGPFQLPTNLPLQETEEEIPFYLSAYPTSNAANTAMSFQINANTSNTLLYEENGKWKIEGTPDIVTSGFDGNDKFYYVTEAIKNEAEYTYDYTLQYPASGKKIKLPEYPFGLTFIEGSDNWYMQLQDGGVYFSDKKTEENAFALRFDKKERKLYWMSLEGQTIFLNSKQF